jgi:hypothetical protein
VRYNAPLLNFHKKEHETLMNVEELLKLPRLGIDDEFTFGCDECGQCCKDRDDILLNAGDLFNISKHLNMSITDVLEKYCEHYLGAGSKMPVVRIKFREYDKTCSFLRKGKCTIHAVKPTVCALFPLGRISDRREDVIEFLLQDYSCGNKDSTYTVREWLSKHGIKEERVFNSLWHDSVIDIVEMLHNKYDRLSKDKQEILYWAVFVSLYLDYNLEKGFEEQFVENITRAKRAIKEVCNERL